MFNFTKGYSNKSNAIRAMKAAFVNSEAYKGETGQWFIRAPQPVVVVAKKPRGGRKTKFSAVAKPCAVVREFVQANPVMPRGEALAFLVSMGVDRTTASIQFHRAHRAA